VKEKQHFALGKISTPPPETKGWGGDVRKSRKRGYKRLGEGGTFMKDFGEVIRQKEPTEKNNLFNLDVFELRHGGSYLGRG